MENLLMCRMCLVTDVPLSSISNNLQNMYKKLTSITFQGKDKRPVVVCHICHARLRNCYRLQISCLKSEERLAEMQSSNVFEPQQLSCTNTFRVVSAFSLSMGHTIHLNVPRSTECLIKEETPDMHFEHELEVVKMETEDEHGAQTDDNIQCSRLDVPPDNTERVPNSVETGTLVLKKPEIANKNIGIATSNTKATNNEADLTSQKQRANKMTVDNDVRKQRLNKVICKKKTTVLKKPKLAKKNIAIATDNTNATNNEADLTSHKHRANETTVDDDIRKQRLNKVICKKKTPVFRKPEIAKKSIDIAMSNTNADLTLHKHRGHETTVEDDIRKQRLNKVICKKKTPAFRKPEKVNKNIDIVTSNTNATNKGADLTLHKHRANKTIVDDDVRKQRLNKKPEIAKKNIDIAMSTTNAINDKTLVFKKAEIAKKNIDIAMGTTNKINDKTELTSDKHRTNEMTVDNDVRNKVICKKKTTVLEKPEIAKKNMNIAVSTTGAINDKTGLTSDKHRTNERTVDDDVRKHRFNKVICKKKTTVLKKPEIANKNIDIATSNTNATNNDADLTLHKHRANKMPVDDDVRKHRFKQSTTSKKKTLVFMKPEIAKKNIDIAMSTTNAINDKTLVFKKPEITKKNIDIAKSTTNAINDKTLVFKKPEIAKKNIDIAKSTTNAINDKTLVFKKPEIAKKNIDIAMRTTNAINEKTLVLKKAEIAKKNIDIAMSTTNAINDKTDLTSDKHRTNEMTVDNDVRNKVICKKKTTVLEKPELAKKNINIAVSTTGAINDKTDLTSDKHRTNERTVDDDVRKHRFNKVICKKKTTVLKKPEIANKNIDIATSNSNATNYDADLTLHKHRAKPEIANKNIDIAMSTTNEINDKILIFKKPEIAKKNIDIAMSTTNEINDKFLVFKKPEIAKKNIDIAMSTTNAINDKTDLTADKHRTNKMTVDDDVRNKAICKKKITVLEKPEMAKKDVDIATSNTNATNNKADLTSHKHKANKGTVDDDVRKHRFKKVVCLSKKKIKPKALKTGIGTEEKRFQCDVCNKCFIRKAHLILHLHTHTGVKPYACNVCQRCFIQKSKLTRHIRTHTNEKPYICDVCNKGHAQKHGLVQHMRIHMSDKLYECDFCKKCFIRKCTLIEHIRIHTGDNPFKCNVCKKYFTRKSSLIDHIRIHTGEKPFICEVCSKCFTKKDTLIEHSRTHTHESCSHDKMYVCDLCNTGFSKKNTLVNHIRSHTGERPYLCEICNKRFSTSSAISRHIRTHAGHKPYECNICKKCFRSNNELTGHVRTHTGDKTFKCDFCEKCFSKISALTYHIRSHTGDRPYMCQICNKSYLTTSALNRHIRIHTGDNTYTCNICRKTFPNNDELKGHKLTHSSKRTYSCKLCEKTFLATFNLKRHMLTHTGHNTYICDLCKKCFTRKDTLIGHIRSHKGDRRYKCKMCNKRFRSSNGLRRHIPTHSVIVKS